MCAGCNGQGMKTMARQIGPMIQRFQTVCPDCSGDGEIISKEGRCKGCLGKKTISERKILHVHVDKGMQDGQKITFNGEGDQGPDIIPGDVIFVIEQKPHARFQRKGDDLYFHTEIDLLTALAGGSVAVEHLDERWLTVSIAAGEVIGPGMFDIISSRASNLEAYPSPQVPSRLFAAKACLHTVTTTTAISTSNSM